MTEWATPKAGKAIHRFSESWGGHLLAIVFGCLIARANILGIYPFGIAYISVLALNKDKKLIPGLIGIILGILSAGEVVLFREVLPAAVLCMFFIPKISGRRGERFIFPVLTAVLAVIPALAGYFLRGPVQDERILSLLVLGVLTAGFSLIFFYAFSSRDSLMKGDFSGEQGIAWTLLLCVALSGLQDVVIGVVNIQIVVLCFFLLYIADRYGSGAGAGAGAIMGFLLQWDFGMGNLVNAGIYGLLGFICGGFRKLGKIGLTFSFSAFVLVVTFFVNEDFLSSHLYSSGLGMLAFLLLPGKRKDKIFIKKKAMPQVETTVNKVKTFAELFDQLAYSFQAAGLEPKLKPEVPELINTLVEKICKNCSMASYCWEKEFYRTYNFMFDLFAYQEEALDCPDGTEDVPPEWDKNCIRLQEVMLAASFILEQQKDKEVWQKRLALNRDAVAEQYRSVSKVIGHLARELHAHHNREEGKPLVWSRQHKTMLDMGVGTFIKTGNGISGDNFSSVPLSTSKIALIVCDGMGVGEEAARMSSAALTILEQLLSTGFEPEGAVKALNSILVLRSPEESFVTVDMAVIDIETESAKLIKIGAAPTYILSKDSVEVIETSSLPAGILNDIDIPVIDVSIKEKTLVIVTDGILDVVNKKEDWLKVYLEKTKNSSSQQLADNVISEAVRLAGPRLEDDGVVLVVKKKTKPGKNH